MKSLGNDELMKYLHSIVSDGGDKARVWVNFIGNFFFCFSQKKSCTLFHSLLSTTIKPVSLYNSVYIIELDFGIEMQRQEELQSLIDSLEMELSQKLLEDSEKIQDLRSERDFYFQKLRKIEQVKY